MAKFVAEFECELDQDETPADIIDSVQELLFNEGYSEVDCREEN